MRRVSWKITVVCRSIIFYDTRHIAALFWFTQPSGSRSRTQLNWSSLARGNLSSDQTNLRLRGAKRHRRQYSTSQERRIGNQWYSSCSSLRPFLFLFLPFSLSLSLLLILKNLEIGGSDFSINNESNLERQFSSFESIFILNVPSRSVHSTIPSILFVFQVYHITCVIILSTCKIWTKVYQVNIMRN